MRASGSRWAVLWAQVFAVTLGLASADAAAQPAPAKEPAKPAAAQPAGAKPTAAQPAGAKRAAAQRAAAQPPARPPLADSLTGMAKAEHGAGVVLFQEGDYAGAIEKFEQAYELSRDHRLLWNVALCQKNLRRYARLLQTLVRMEKEAGEGLTAEERKEVAELRKVAESLVSRVEIRASEAGATVLVGSEVVGTTPLAEPVLVDIGEHRIRITKPGFKDFMRPERIEGGGRIAIAAMLEKVVHRGRLAVVAGPEDLIALDGRVVGRGRWEGSVPSGTHALRVTAPGKQAHTSEVLVRDNEARRVDVGLNPERRGSSMSTWLWIGGGVALVAGAAVAGAVLFEPGRPAEQGTLGSIPLSFGGRR